MTKETYQKSVDILLDAYNNNELMHGNCAACAVGNLISKQGKFLGEDYRKEAPIWMALFMTSPEGIQQPELLIRRMYGETKPLKEISVTNCTREELAKIEFAFETSIINTKEGYDYYKSPENEKRGQYIGLCAVLDVMATMIDNDEEVSSIENKEKLTIIAKEKFAVEV